jgi:hypothetical protein
MKEYVGFAILLTLGSAVNAEQQSCNLKDPQPVYDCRKAADAGMKVAGKNAMSMIVASNGARSSATNGSEFARSTTVVLGVTIKNCNEHYLPTCQNACNSMGPAESLVCKKCCSMAIGAEVRKLEGAIADINTKAQAMRDTASMIAPDSQAPTPAQAGDQIVAQRRGYSLEDLHLTGGAFAPGGVPAGHGIAIANTVNGPRPVLIPFNRWGSESAAKEALGGAGGGLRSVDWGD